MSKPGWVAVVGLSSRAVGSDVGQAVGDLDVVLRRILSSQGAAAHRDLRCWGVDSSGACHAVVRHRGNTAADESRMSDSVLRWRDL
jgi:hypothetical protein